ncbi:hypothetical protein [Bacillus sp. 2205SS5-2]|uniref:hypothetical protein n=1 Tax=Bacillus sp. 2205SS5-2 TaxID=3109031 RepID=UPI003007CC72
MTTMIISMFVGSILLFFLSFFLKDHLKQMERDVEELSINMLQEQYKMKRRLKIMEEELMVEPREDMSEFSRTDDVHEVVKNQVLALHDKGLTIEQIAQQSALSFENVQKVILTSK